MSATVSASSGGNQGKVGRSEHLHCWGRYSSIHCHLGMGLLSSVWMHAVNTTLPLEVVRNTLAMAVFAVVIVGRSASLASVGERANEMILMMLK